MKTVYIYALKCPVSGLVRYIGETTNPAQRLREHRSTTSKRKHHCGRWINCLMSRGLEPVLSILTEITDGNWQFWEREYIKLYREIGFDLTNSTEGGECGPGLAGERHPLWGKVGYWAGRTGPNKGKKEPPETLAKKRATMLGEKNHFFGKTHSAESKEKIRLSRIGKISSYEARQKMRIAHLARWKKKKEYKLC